MKYYWCWRCRAEVPMLAEHEWEPVKRAEEEMQVQIKEELRKHKERMKKHRAKWNYRLRKQGTIEELEEERALSDKNKIGEIISTYVSKRDKVFENILGGFNTKILCSLDCHARPLYGPECENCGKLLRGPSSTYCFECGWKKK